ncbi:uncharacterized protein LOC119877766 [Canis lupus familiaris]|uniref:uncharacterized protein LOC119877766 n=1 Tax=Canis lupus familiaris TaxID=9615 RepID=UPI0018F6045B|nr:uncharacterized protein LOC119877766 [Canis lupus familiaris]
MPHLSPISEVLMGLRCPLHNLPSGVTGSRAAGLLGSGPDVAAPSLCWNVRGAAPWRWDYCGSPDTENAVGHELGARPDGKLRGFLVEGSPCPAPGGTRPSVFPAADQAAKFPGQQLCPRLASVPGDPRGVRTGTIRLVSLWPEKAAGCVAHHRPAKPVPAGRKAVSATRPLRDGDVVRWRLLSLLRDVLCRLLIQIPSVHLCGRPLSGLQGREVEDCTSVYHAQKRTFPRVTELWAAGAGDHARPGCRLLVQPLQPKPALQGHFQGAGDAALRRWPVPRDVAGPGLEAGCPSPELTGEHREEGKGVCVCVCVRAWIPGEGAPSSGARTPSRCGAGAAERESLGKLEPRRSWKWGCCGWKEPLVPERSSEDTEV